jgi:hypothetical protein
VRATYNTGRPDIPSFVVNGVQVANAVGTADVLQRRLPSFYRIDQASEVQRGMESRIGLARAESFFMLLASA